MPNQNHILVIPVYNLVLGKNINKEIQIEKITFIDKDKLIRCRKRFGFGKPFSEMGAFLKKMRIKLLDSAQTYAVLKYKIDPKDTIATPMAKIREATWILASQQFGYRRNIYRFGFPEYRGHHLSDSFLYNLVTKKINVKFKAHNVIHHTINRKWSTVKQFHFFSNTLKIINGEFPVCKKWKMDIKKAVILCGKSVFSSELSEAFLYNMIALETLLTDKTGKHRELLKERLNAIFHWTGENWDTAIDRIYKLRCDMVHNGDVSKITTEDLLYSDHFLNNLLLNIGNATKVIKEKDDLIQMAKEYDACQILGKKYKSKIKKSVIIYYSNSQKDIEKIQKEMNWER